MPVQSKQDVITLARLFKAHGSKYSPEKREILKRHICRAAATVNLANTQTASAQGQTGKTRTQPRQYGGKFGVKSATPAPQYTPAQIAEAIDNLKPGQTINLPNNAGKVRRLTSGFQIVSPNGETNIVVRSAQMAASRANSMAKVKGGGK